MPDPRRRTKPLLGALVVAAGAATGFLLAPKETGLAADLPSDPNQMAQVWNERVQAAFPDGTPVPELLAQLQSAKFQIKEGQSSVSRSRTDLFGGCSSFLIVDWQAEEGKASRVAGRVLTC